MKCCITGTCRQFFATLANPTRLAILEILQNGPRNVAEISQVLKHERTMISHNLKPLEDCAFVFSERKGKNRVYSINKEVIEPLFELFNFHASKYCPNGRVCLTTTGYTKYKKNEAGKDLYISHE